MALGVGAEAKGYNCIAQACKALKTLCKQ